MSINFAQSLIVVVNYMKVRLSLPNLRLNIEDIIKGYSAFGNSEPYLLRPLLRAALLFDAVPFDAFLVSFCMAALLSFSVSSTASRPSSSSLP